MYGVRERKGEGEREKKREREKNCEGERDGGRNRIGRHRNLAIS